MYKVNIFFVKVIDCDLDILYIYKIDIMNILQNKIRVKNINNKINFYFKKNFIFLCVYKI